MISDRLHTDDACVVAGVTDTAPDAGTVTVDGRNMPLYLTRGGPGHTVFSMTLPSGTNPDLGVSYKLTLSSGGRTVIDCSSDGAAGTAENCAA